MKSVLTLASLLLVFSSCAPKASLVDEANQPAQPTVAKKQDKSPETDELPNFKPNDGLLDPSGISSMPTANDMRPTVDQLDGSRATVIANPPDDEPATSE